MSKFTEFLHMTSNFLMQSDKRMHIQVSFAIMVLTHLILMLFFNGNCITEKRLLDNLILAWIFTMSIGMLKEVLDYSIVGRNCELADFVADFIGCTGYVLLYLFLMKVL